MVFRIFRIIVDTFVLKKNNFLYLYYAVIACRSYVFGGTHVFLQRCFSCSGTDAFLQLSNSMTEREMRLGNEYNGL